MGGTRHWHGVGWWRGWPGATKKLASGVGGFINILWGQFGGFKNWHLSYKITCKSIDLIEQRLHQPEKIGLVRAKLIEKQLFSLS